MCNPVGIWGEDRGGMDILGGEKERHTGKGAERGNSEPHCLGRFRGHEKQDVCEPNCEDCQVTGTKSLERETGMA